MKRYTVITTTKPVGCQTETTKQEEYLIPNGYDIEKVAQAYHNEKRNILKKLRVLKIITTNHATKLCIKMKVSGNRAVFTEGGD